MSKITDTIKLVQNAAEAVLNRQVSPTEIIQTIEAIEVLVGADKSAEPIKTTTVVTRSPITQAPDQSNREPQSGKKHKYPKHRKPVTRKVNWLQYQEWVDMVLNGNTHNISMSNLEEVYINKGQLRGALHRAAKRRGMKTVHVWFNDKNNTVRIQAVK